MTNNKPLVTKNLSFTLFLFVLFLGLLVFSAFLINNIRSLNRQDTLQHYRSIRNILTNHQITKRISLSDVNYIDEWMTFKYINTIFSLPDNYLKDKLNIADTRFPNISLNRYATTNKIDKHLFIGQVKIAVTSYLQNSTK